MAGIVSLFGPAIPADPDTAAVTLGLRFTPKTAGLVAGIAFWTSPANKGPHIGALWGPDGKRLAMVTFPATAGTGWHGALFDRPVETIVGREYTVSYRAPHGRYAATNNAFTKPVTTEHLAAPAGAGVYTYGDGPPTQSWKNSSYFVDVLYAPGAQPPPPPPPGGLSTGWHLTADNVGLRPLGIDGTQLPAYTGPIIVPRGTLITEKRITGHLDLSAGAITIERSLIRPPSAGRGLPIITTTHYDSGRGTPERVIIRDSEFDGTLLGQEAAAYATGFIGIADLARNYVHGFGSGLAVMNAGDHLDAVIEHNYVTGLVAWGDGATTGNHSDAFTIRDFDATDRPDRTLIVRNNRFDCDSGNDTGAFFIQTYAGRIDNVTVEGNLLEGKGYQLGMEETRHPYSRMRAVNNRFTGTGWGPAYVTRGPGWEQWAENHIYDAAAVDGRGRLVGRP